MGCPPQLPTTMSSCQARILGEEYTIEGTDVKCHRTRECGAVAMKKITIDDGDAFFHICSSCFRRFLTKGSSKIEKDEWLGWFDCSYPPHAHVYGSAWYHNVVREAWEEKQQKATADGEVLAPSKRDILKGQIKELELWFKGEGRLKPKEQPAKARELLKLRTELRMP